MREMRTLDKKFGIIPVWNEHPMFGINCDECKDKWAVAYQENAQLADKIFDILIERANVELTGDRKRAKPAGGRPC